MVIIKGDLLKVVFIWRNLRQCYIVLEEIINLCSEEGLNYLFMPVSCDTFYAGKLFSKVITVFFCWVIGHFLNPILMVTSIKQMSLFGFGTSSVEMQVKYIFLQLGPVLSFFR